MVDIELELASFSLAAKCSSSHTLKKLEDGTCECALNVSSGVNLVI